MVAKYFHLNAEVFMVNERNIREEEIDISENKSFNICLCFKNFRSYYSSNVTLLRSFFDYKDVIKSLVSQMERGISTYKKNVGYKMKISVILPLQSVFENSAIDTLQIYNGRNGEYLQCSKVERSIMVEDVKEFADLCRNSMEQNTGQKVISFKYVANIFNGYLFLCGVDGR